jgi:aerobic-type carbon monoxide dehydrogenase small subunit (CoxS/CutS family)
VFPGTAEERDALLAALRIDCTCKHTKDGHTVVCGAHALLLDERSVKHLIFYRRCRAVLWPGEAQTV